MPLPTRQGAKVLAVILLTHYAALLAASKTIRSPMINHAVVCAQSTTRVKPFICTMPMRLDDGWNQVQFNLADFTKRAYGELQVPGGWWTSGYGQTAVCEVLQACISQGV